MVVARGSSSYHAQGLVNFRTEGVGGLEGACIVGFLNEVQAVIAETGGALILHKIILTFADSGNNQNRPLFLISLCWP